MKKAILFLALSAVAIAQILVGVTGGSPVTSSSTTFTLLAHVEAQNTGTSPAVTITGVNTGEMLLVIGEGTGNGITLSSVTGSGVDAWTVVGSGTQSATNGYNSYIAVGKATVSGSVTATLTFSGSGLTSATQSISRVSSSATFPASASIKDNYGTARGLTLGSNSGNYTVASGTEMAVAVYAGMYNATRAVPSGWNTIYCPSNYGICAAWFPVTAAGTATFTTSGTAIDWQVSTATLKGQ